MHYLFFALQFFKTVETGILLPSISKISKCHGVIKEVHDIKRVRKLNKRFKKGEIQ